MTLCRCCCVCGGGGVGVCSIGTVAERNTAAAAQAALGPPKSRRWPPKGRPIGCGWPPQLSRARQNFKIVTILLSSAHEWLTGQR